MILNGKRELAAAARELRSGKTLMEGVSIDCAGVRYWILTRCEAWRTDHVLVTTRPSWSRYLAEEVSR